MTAFATVLWDIGAKEKEQLCLVTSIGNDKSFGGGVNCSEMFPILDSACVGYTLTWLQANRRE